MRTLAGHGLILDGHDVDRAAAIEQARTYLVAAGMDSFDADAALIDRRGLVVRGWWGDDARGFVQGHHDGAQPVTVINVNVPEATS